MKNPLSRGLSAVLAAAALLAAAAPAHAAPVTVQLRVEGPTKTVFEGPVTTDVGPFRFTNEATEHQCDGTNAAGGSEPAAVPTRGAALTAAALQTPFSMTGQWFSFGPSITEIGGENVAYDSTSGKYLTEWRNFQFAQVGACADPIANGDDVLFAYDVFDGTPLKLAGPATARPNEAFGVTVVDGKTGAAQSGATVAGATTGGDGTASVVLTQRGVNRLKAEKPGTIRSNALVVCVTDGADGFCGTQTPQGEVKEPAPAPPVTAPSTDCATNGRDGRCGSVDRTSPFAAIDSILEGRVFARGRGPRVLRGHVDDTSSLRMVKLRLTRQIGGRCWTWSASKERFVPRPCGVANGWYFRIGDKASWSYLLPKRLGTGRYVLDVNAVDQQYNRDDARRRGQNRIVFRVR